MTHSDEPLMRLEGLTVDFDIGRRYVRALHGVDLTVRRGETLGVVGESGCGKSITWLAALALLGKSTKISGSVRFDGQELVGMAARDLCRIRGGRVALIFQDPASALNPVHRIGTQIGEALRLHRGLRGAEARKAARDLIDRVGISNPDQRLNEYPHELSGGMNQRVMIAMALAGDPDLLIADEPTTALDVTIQAQILDLLRTLQAETGMGMVLISHDLGVISDVADRVAVMYAGRVIEEAPAVALFDAPAHPYSSGLLAALPDMEGPRRRLEAIPGAVPAPHDLPPGCAFAARCAARRDMCEESPPRLREVPWANLSRRAACERLEVLNPKRTAAVPAAPAVQRVLA
ncbi:ABC transporter ATP-binding protein (plasmid) [Paracoccus liaowanqingii]|uniref:ABC transporter ATP-binding protein n=1 Tax=Paracoccus liaowanqingii TaxID=2560053 RepID=A0A4Y5SU80_9RHOB|nr:ABC transporter ATP-binding protein [Paracoccus liaowanqingii]QDA36274.1 ABC transporter ATP-binding protein [Paracoccus liaowanqingii]